MNDTPTFSPFATQPPPVPMFEGETAVPKKRRGKANPASRGRKGGSKPKLVHPSVISSEPAKAPTKRKARKPQALKIDPMIVFEAAIGLGLNDVSGIARIMEEIQKFPKKSRAKIVAALAKVFA